MTDKNNNRNSDSPVSTDGSTVDEARKIERKPRTPRTHLEASLIGIMCEDIEELYYSLPYTFSDNAVPISTTRYYLQCVAHWIARNGTGVPSVNYTRSSAPLFFADWVLAAHEFSFGSTEHSFHLEMSEMIQRHETSERNALHYDHGRRIQVKADPDREGNPFQSTKIPLGMKHALEREVKWLENQVDGQFVEVLTLPDPPIHDFDLIPTELLFHEDDPSWAVSIDSFVKGRDENGMLLKNSDRRHTCSVTGEALIAPMFVPFRKEEGEPELQQAVVYADMLLRAKVADKWRFTPADERGSVIQKNPFVKLLTNWMRQYVEIDGYHTYVDRLAPTKAEERVTAHPLIELSKVVGYNYNAEEKSKPRVLEAALEDVLSQLESQDDETRRLVSAYCDVRAVMGVRFNDGTTTDKTARLDLDVKPVFIGNCTGDVTHRVQTANGNSAEYGLKRGKCVYPWLHSKVVKHDVSSASTKIGVIDTKKTSLEFVTFGIADIDDSISAYFMGSKKTEPSFHALEYNITVAKTLKKTSRNLEELRNLVLQTLTRILPSRTKWVLENKEIKKVQFAQVPEEWKEALFKAISGKDPKTGKTRRPKPQLDYYRKLLDLEWNFTVTEDGTRRFGRPDKALRHEYLKKMNFSLYVVGLVEGEIVKKARFPALSKQHLMRKEVKQ